MDIIKAVVAGVVGALLGGAVAVLFVATCASTAGIPDDAGLALLSAGVSVLGCILGGGFLGGYLYRPRELQGASMLTPDGEKDARAKFMPGSDTAADDGSIQLDKRGLKPEDC